MLSGKKILLGITGSIAAYKAAVLSRLLVKHGAEVKVLMTPAALEFITPTTMSALTGKPVSIYFFNRDDGAWDSHVDMGNWADLMLIAPITANTMAKMATGQADNLLLTTYLSCNCPVIIAPAMDLQMFRHVSTIRNLEQLQKDGVKVIEPSEGVLASGLHGKGRMEEPEKIVDKLQSIFSRSIKEEDNKKKS